jgi:hypothetical protein
MPGLMQGKGRLRRRLGRKETEGGQGALPEGFHNGHLATPQGPCQAIGALGAVFGRLVSAPASSILAADWPCLTRTRGVTGTSALLGPARFARRLGEWQATDPDR